MIQILELIKHFVLGIASAFLFINITMADIGKTKDFMKAIEEVRQEYPEDSIERKIPTSFIPTVLHLGRTIQETRNRKQETF